MLEKNSAWAAFALGQLTATQPEVKPQHFNPRPAGMFQTGGAAQAVHAFLEAHPGRFYTLGQLIAATGRSDKALDWACRFLCSTGRVEWRNDESRNSRYRRYGFKPATAADEGQS